MFKNTITTKIEVKEAINFENIDQIGMDQDNEYLEGWFSVWAEIIEEHNLSKDIIKGMDIDENSILIATKDEYRFKRGDLVKLYGVDEYVVNKVKTVIDPKYANIIRLFPNSRRMYTWKILELGA